VRSQAASFPAQEPKVSRLPSGVTVASVENYSPVARIAVFYNAGSRCESGDNLGVTHVLRNAVNLSTQNQTNFGIVRNIQQIGGNLSCSTTREHMVYSVDCLRNSLDTGLEYLQEVATSPAFKPWELSTLSERLDLDLAQLSTQPQARLMEALHQAAFRNTLGRSLYIQPNRIASFNGAMLSQFVQDFYTAGNMAIVGVGVDHDQLAFAAKKFSAGQGGAQIAPATYCGGELRVDEPGPLSSVALVTQGASLSSADAIAVGVLQQVMGTRYFR
jgi:ubiquinol-cytochrome c reductase core subunit 2